MYIKKQKVCSACPCFNLMDGCCNLTDGINEKPCDTTLPDCPLPLSTLPESHGDLIDRNKLIDKLSERTYCHNCNNMNGILCTNCSKRNNDDRIIDCLYGEDVIIEATE